MHFFSMGMHRRRRDDMGFAGILRRWSTRARDHWPLIAILVIGTLLRLTGLKHGIGLHNDESSIVSNSSWLRLGQLRPPNFFYGSLLFYLVWFCGAIARFVGFDLRTFESWVILSRAISIVGGVLGILLTYLLGRELFEDKRIALVGAALLAFNELHIQLSRFYTSDVLLTTACVFTLLALVAYAKRRTFASAMAAGAGLGVSLALKASALSLLLPMFVAFALTHLHQRQLEARHVIVQCLSVLFAAVVALALQPYILIEFTRFKIELLDQIHMVRGDVRMPWNNQYYGTPAYIYPFEQMLWYTIGIPVMLAALGGMWTVGSRQLREGWTPEAIMLLWTIAVFLTIGRYQVKFLRYLLPIYPPLTLYAAYFVCSLEDRFASAGAPRSRWMSNTLLVWAAIGGLAFANIYRKDHIHRAASDWICANLRSGAIILQIPWDTQLPRCTHIANMPRYEMGPEWEVPMFDMPQNKKLTEKVLEKLAKGDYIVFPTTRAFRSLFTMSEEYPAMHTLIRLLVAGDLGYTLIKTFKYNPSLGPLVFNDDLADESLETHDHPKVYLFENRAHLGVAAMREILETGHGQGRLPSLKEMLSKSA
jgi:Dolichyl-phosphate-mannose-protein mannosyltransferase